jgi:hypothetical protein
VRWSSPELGIERTQIRIFAGSDVLQTPFDAAFIRAGAIDLDGPLGDGALAERPVEQRDSSAPTTSSGPRPSESFVVDLGDFSTDTWSLSPSRGDLLAEVRTRRFDTLTYAKSHNEAETSACRSQKRRNISCCVPGPACCTRHLMRRG